MKDTLKEPVASSDSELESSQKATPLRCFIASIISGVFAFGLYLLFSSIVQTYATKTITSNSAIAINLASAVRTLVMGTVALATGVFGMVAIGIFLLGIQLMIQNFKKA
ncbi:DUF3082 domain-containing protein [Waterburya agarophytonicola K14]|uniref:DUF3082 domain-containing protein n=1 Tax=Waterburya agarophytonicola KI4 TaxID=2874699 RepID=A0A964BMR0_9CYAN|nr:DUF3082 domain-containing protein [Waterburya agarophytonicola]MCC0176175.1 DUF3082 domain-containing protein [Waterburya agarophytonicola KI4]